MAYLEGYEHDVFVSYAHIDNRPDREGERGWVESFERALKLRDGLDDGLAGFDPLPGLRVDFRDNAGYRCRDGMFLQASFGDSYSGLLFRGRGLGNQTFVFGLFDCEPSSARGREAAGGSCC